MEFCIFHLACFLITPEKIFRPGQARKNKARPNKNQARQEKTKPALHEKGSSQANPAEVHARLDKVQASLEKFKPASQKECSSQAKPRLEKVQAWLELSQAAA